jgi:preprotein translocase subunit SecE
MAWTTQVRDFVKEVEVESRKVSWPSRNELRDSTIVVIATVVLLTAFVYVVDGLLRLGLGLLLR